jgi:hypothetical protein
MTETPPPFQYSRDGQHLKLLVIFHFIYAGLSVFYMAFLFLHYMIMSTVFSNPHMFDNARQPPPFDPVQFIHAFMWFYVFMGAWGLISLIANITSALCLRARKNRMLSLVVAGLNCIGVPFGTALGVCTIIVLIRPSVMPLYHESPSN